ncbi:MAG: acyl-CoA synthetase [Rhodospirillales bacterium]
MDESLAKLTDYTTYRDAHLNFKAERLWDLFEGNREHFNIAHECIDRHATGSARVAVRIAHADGHDDTLTFQQLAERSNRFANLLKAEGIQSGERVAIMLEPEEAYYVALFGCMKAGCIAVPLFTLFGEDGLKLRIEDCKPSALLTNSEKMPIAKGFPNLKLWVTGSEFEEQMKAQPSEFSWKTKGNDLACFQYTSGTTRELPDAIRHTHRSLVTLMSAALYGTGIRPGDRFCCPSSIAWGHGLWHGTLAPLALGVETMSYAGRFDPKRLVQAMRDFGTTNLSAAATHYRLMMNTEGLDLQGLKLQKLSFTGEPIDSETANFCEIALNQRPRSMYGTTEVGVILVSYPGAHDFVMKPGSLGKPPPGVDVRIHRADGSEANPDETGEIVVERRGQWFPTKDLGRRDKDGYFYHGGRADDVIISAGWTMSAVEIEDAILRHDDVLEAACIGVPDTTRGQVVKAFLVAKRNDTELVEEVQNMVRERLSQHEYPRLVEIVKELPKTPAGKVNRKVLRDRERSKLEENKV